MFRTDIYFTKYCLAIEIDEKGHTDRDLIFEEKRQKALEKKLNCTFIRINTSKENYDADYEVSRIQTFISQFKDFQFNLFILFYYYFVSFRQTTVVMITQVLYQMVSKLFIRL